MGNTVKNTTGDEFTRVPFNWSSRIEYSLEKRVAVSYIATRANIQEIEWELVAADIVKKWGISKATISKIMKWLESIGVIHFVELRKVSGDFPSKIYRIDRTELEKLMTPPDSTVCHTNCHGSSSKPPRFTTRTATVSLANLEEEVKEENNKKSLKEEGKSEIPSFFNSVSGSTPAKKSLEEQFEDAFRAVTKYKSQSLSGTSPEPLANADLFISGQTVTVTTPALDTKGRPIDSGLPEGVEHHQSSLTVPDELSKRIRKTEAAREVEKWKGRRPELVGKYLEEFFARGSMPHN